MEGEAENLPSLITGRYNHACGVVARSDGSIVSLETWKPDECNFLLTTILQTYIVTGGRFYGNQILSSTEILEKDRGTSWKSAAELPYSANSLRGVSLDNGLFIVTGEDILGMVFLNWLTISLFHKEPEFISLMMHTCRWVQLRRLSISYLQVWSPNRPVDHNRRAQHCPPRSRHQPGAQGDSGLLCLKDSL